MFAIQQLPTLVPGYQLIEAKALKTFTANASASALVVIVAALYCFDDRELLTVQI